MSSTEPAHLLQEPATQATDVRPDGESFPQAGSASEEPFRLFVESLKDYAIFTLAVEGHITSWNKGAARIKGLCAQPGKHLVLYPPEDIRQGNPSASWNAPPPKDARWTKAGASGVRVHASGRTWSSPR